MSQLPLSSRGKLEELVLAPPALIAIDIETTGLNANDETFSAAVSWFDALGFLQSAWIHLDRYSRVDVGENEIAFQCFLNATLFNPSGYKGTVVFHNLAYDLPYLLRRFYRPPGSTEPARPWNYIFRSKDFARIHDSQVLSRCLRNNKYSSHLDPRAEKAHSLKFLAREHLGVAHTSFMDAVGYGSIRAADLKKVEEYNRKDAELTLRLYLHLKKLPETMGRPGEWWWFEKHEMSFTLAMAAANFSGVRVDVKRTRCLATRITRAMDRIEGELFRLAGRSFNLGSNEEIARALFRNYRLTYLRRGKKAHLLPLYKTDTGLPKVDIGTFVKLRHQIRAEDPGNTSTLRAVNLVIQYLELTNAFKHIEIFQRHWVRLPNGEYRLFPKFSADAKTGRVRCGSPNILGLGSAIFDEEHSEVTREDKDLWRVRKYKSIRKLLIAPKDCEIISIDISGLDLGAIAAGLLRHDPNTYWKECFERYGPDRLTLDTHLAILRVVFPEKFQRALEHFLDAPQMTNVSKEQLTDFFITKKLKEHFYFIRANNQGPIIRVPAKQELGGKELTFGRAQEYKQERGTGKTSNLAVTYCQGTNSLGLGLSTLEEPVSEKEAALVIQKYGEAFPEILAFRDELANAVWENGYYESLFGRLIYADVFDVLNACYRKAKRPGEDDQYEFILHFEDKYWYVRASGWQKSDGPIFHKMKLEKGRPPLSFKKINMLYRLNRNTFIQKKRFQKKRQSESRSNEQCGFEKNLFAIAHEVDGQVKDKLGNFITAWEPDAERARRSWMRDDVYHIPETHVLFYRVAELGTPSSKYFHAYKSLASIARPFFAVYHQALAAMIAKVCMNRIQGWMESVGGPVQLLAFVHDQFDIIWPKGNRELAEQMLTNHIEDPIALAGGGKFPIEFFGEVKFKGRRFQ